MSTRGGIGAVAGDVGIRFVYQHYDSYPTVLGQSLLDEYRRIAATGTDDVLAELRRAIDDHPGGWASYPERCFCHEGEEEAEPMQMECRCGAGDPSGCNPLFIEWLYVLNGRGLDVYKSVQTGLTVEMTGYHGQTYHQPGYRHVFIGTLPWDASEADVEAMEERGHEVFEVAYEEHGSAAVS